MGRSHCDAGCYNDAGHGQRPFHAANLIHCGGLPLHFHHAGSYAALVKALKEEKL